MFIAAARSTIDSADLLIGIVVVALDLEGGGGGAALPDNGALLEFTGGGSLLTEPGEFLLGSEGATTTEGTLGARGLDAIGGGILGARARAATGGGLFCGFAIVGICGGMEAAVEGPGLRGLSRDVVGGGATFRLGMTGPTDDALGAGREC